MCVLALAVIVMIMCYGSTASLLETKEKKPQRPSVRTIFQELRHLLQAPSMTFFMFQVGLMGFIMVLVDAILPLQLERELHVSRVLNGSLTLISILSSLPVFHHGVAIRHRYSTAHLMRGAQAVTALRLCGYVACKSLGSFASVAVVLLTLLHGACYALTWIVATAVVQSRAPSSLSSSAQMLVTTTYFTLGQGFGNIFWHYGFTQAGEKASALYMCGGVMLLLNLAVTVRPWRRYFGKDHRDKITPMLAV